jgi:hypothetical protein
MPVGEQKRIDPLEVVPSRLEMRLVAREPGIERVDGDLPLPVPKPERRRIQEPVEQIPVQPRIGDRERDSRLPGIRPIALLE